MQTLIIDVMEPETTAAAWAKKWSFPRAPVDSLVTSAAAPLRPFGVQVAVLFSAHRAPVEARIPPRIC